MSGKKFGKHYYQDDLTAMGDVILDKFKNAVPDPTKFLQTDATGKIIQGTPAGGGGGFIALTYAQFAALYDDSNLSPGTWYMITDFATNHMIKEITTTGLVDTTEENLAPTESLLLFAYSQFDYLHDYAFLPDYGERCTYELFNGTPSLQPGTNFKGVITRRYNDNLNVSMPMDWRNIVWKVGSDYWKPVENVGTMYNVYIANPQYNLPQPIIIYGDRLINVNISEPQFWIAVYSMVNISAYRVGILNVNVRLEGIMNTDISSTFNDLVYAGFGSAINVQNITAHGSRCTVGGIDLAELVKFNNCFLFTDPVGGERRGIQVNTSTNLISIIS